MKNILLKGNERTNQHLFNVFNNCLKNSDGQWFFQKNFKTFFGPFISTINL